MNLVLLLWSSTVAMERIARLLEMAVKLKEQRAFAKVCSASPKIYSVCVESRDDMNKYYISFFSFAFMTQYKLLSSFYEEFTDVYSSNFWDLSTLEILQGLFYLEPESNQL